MDKPTTTATNHHRKKTGLVEEALAKRRTAKAGDTVQTAYLSLELVVVRQLLVYGNLSAFTIFQLGSNGRDLLRAMSRSA
jgi:hypothetical protein